MINAGNTPTAWLIWVFFFLFLFSQALQSQKRSKPMARCSAVINSSTGFSHVLIIGSGQCVVLSVFLKTPARCRLYLQSGSINRVIFQDKKTNLKKDNWLTWTYKLTLQTDSTHVSNDTNKHFIKYNFEVNTALSLHYIYWTSWITRYLADYFTLDLALIDLKRAGGGMRSTEWLSSYVSVVALHIQLLKHLYLENVLPCECLLQVPQLWCARRRWGRRASPIASSCAPWTDTLPMTGLNWVRFVHRPWPPKKLRQIWLCRESYITHAAAVPLWSAVLKQELCWWTASPHSNKDVKTVTDFTESWLLTVVRTLGFLKRIHFGVLRLIFVLWCTNLLTFSP